ncbi:biotin/lipoyl-containing protein [Sedimentibacter sp.]|uniref:lipoyl domain-containing protein n=1 Tax=Sedimentibacter sp. TaxID=1960295 RepID=UPI0028A6D30B|nr:biotin/lipoyl-containing protein [Sedimentibacter sp.]
MVKKDEPLVQIETFKITTDILAPCEGILNKILYKEFEYCSINDDIAIIGCINK